MMEGLEWRAGGGHLCSDAFRRMCVQKNTVSSNCHSSATTATHVAMIGTTAHRSVPGQSIVCSVSLWTTSLPPGCGQKPADSPRQCFPQVPAPPLPTFTAPGGCSWPCCSSAFSVLPVLCCSSLSFVSEWVFVPVSAAVPVLPPLTCRRWTGSRVSACFWTWFLA